MVFFGFRFFFAVFFCNRFWNTQATDTVHIHTHGHGIANFIVLVRREEYLISSRFFFQFQEQKNRSFFRFEARVFVQMCVCGCSALKSVNFHFNVIALPCVCSFFCFSLSLHFEAVSLPEDVAIAPNRLKHKLYLGILKHKIQFLFECCILLHKRNEIKLHAEGEILYSLKVSKQQQQ